MTANLEGKLNDSMALRAPSSSGFLDTITGILKVAVPAALLYFLSPSQACAQENDPFAELNDAKSAPEAPAPAPQGNEPQVNVQAGGINLNDYLSKTPASMSIEDVCTLMRHALGRQDWPDRVKTNYNTLKTSRDNAKAEAYKAKFARSMQYLAKAQERLRAAGVKEGAIENFTDLYKDNMVKQSHAEARAIGERYVLSVEQSAARSAEQARKRAAARNAGANAQAAVSNPAANPAVPQPVSRPGVYFRGFDTDASAPAPAAVSNPDADPVPKPAAQPAPQPGQPNLPRKVTPRSPVKVYGPSGVGLHVGSVRGDIEGDVFGGHLTTFNDEGNLVFDAFYTGETGDFIAPGADASNPNDISNSVFGVRYSGVDAQGAYTGTVFQFSGETLGLESTFTHVADPRVDGPLTTEQTTVESSEESLSHLGGKLQIGLGDSGNAGFRLGSRTLTQTDTTTDTTRTYGDIPNPGDPNFGPTIPYDNTDVVETENTLKETREGYELFFDGKGDAPFSFKIRWYDSDVTDTTDSQTVNGVPRTGETVEEEKSGVMVALGVSHSNNADTAAGTYLIGFQSGDDVQDRHRPIVYAGGAFASGDAAFGASAQYVNGPGFGVTGALRTGTPDINLDDFVDLMEQNRDTSLPMDPESGSAVDRLNRHTYPAFIDEGVVFDFTKSYGEQGSRLGSKPGDVVSARLAYCNGGFGIQASYFEAEDLLKTVSVLVGLDTKNVSVGVGYRHVVDQELGGVEGGLDKDAVTFGASLNF